MNCEQAFIPIFVPCYSSILFFKSFHFHFIDEKRRIQLSFKLFPSILLKYFTRINRDS